MTFLNDAISYIIETDKSKKLILKYRLIAIGGAGEIFICDQVLPHCVYITLHYKNFVRRMSKCLFGYAYFV